jgi:hypothetical protein
MGAVTAIMYGDRDPSIAGMVLDSPFSSLKTLVEELVKDKVNIPNFIVNQALKLVKSTVQKKAKFKLDDIEPITFAERCFIPCLFVAAKDDNFVKPHHAKILHDIYPGDKNLISVDGDHNSVRPRFFKDSAAIFFYNTLQVQHIKEISDNYAGFNYTKKSEDSINNNNMENNKLKEEAKINTVQKDDNKFFMEDKYSGMSSFEQINEKLNNLELLEDEEEMFRKIIEMSKAEYEQQQNKDTDKEKEKEKEKKDE